LPGTESTTHAQTDGTGELEERTKSDGAFNQAETETPIGMVSWSEGGAHEGPGSSEPKQKRGGARGTSGIAQEKELRKATSEMATNRSIESSVE